jgi:hypothetical protein
MSILEQVLYLNNEGVSLLVSDEEGKAMGLLKQSLHLMKNKFAREQQQQEQQQTNNEHLDAAAAAARNNNTSSTAAILVTGPTKCESTTESEQEQQELSIIYEKVEMKGFRDSSDFFIFNSAIKLSPEALVRHWRKRDPNISILFTACVLFNTAMTYHKYGILQNNQASLGKAVGVYGQTIKLLRTCCQSEMNATCSMIELAALNNLSHIHLIQGDHVQSRQLLEDLASLIAFVGGFDFAPRLFADNHVDQLLVNIFFLIASNSAAAAA